MTGDLADEGSSLIETIDDSLARLLTPGLTLLVPEHLLIGGEQQHHGHSSSPELVITEVAAKKVGPLDEHLGRVVSDRGMTATLSLLSSVCNSYFKPLLEPRIPQAVSPPVLLSLRNEGA